jgi:hypothetical protein
MLKIIKAAIRKDGKIHIGKNHSEIIKDSHFGDLKNGEQGFLTSDYTFVNRIESAKIAVEAGQVGIPKYTYGLDSSELELSFIHI